MSRGKHLNFQHSFWGVIQEVTNHCMWTITLVGVILCDKRILLERELPYTLKSANKQLTHAFLHFVASLQRRLAPISVLYVNIYSSSLRLFKTDLLVSLLSATHGQCLILVLCLPLSWLRVTFVLNTLIALKELFFRPVTWRKYLGLTSLWFCRDIARSKDFRQRYLCLSEVVEEEDKICCLRSTRIRLHNSKRFKQNGLLLNVETGSHELAILSYATVCLHSSVSLNNEKFVVNLVNIK